MKKLTVAGKRVGSARLLTDRDLAILRFIGQGGVAGLKQLHTKFWSGRKERTAEERLTQLVNAGYLDREYVDARRPGEKVFVLKRKGAEEFSLAEREHFIIGLPTPKELKQQLVLQDVRIALEFEIEKRGASIISFQNERELRGLQRAEQRANGPAGTHEIGDARVKILDPSGQIQEIEVEIDGQYFGKMLHEKIRALGRSGREIIWVTSHNRVEKINDEIISSATGNVRVLAM